MSAAAGTGRDQCPAAGDSRTVQSPARALRGWAVPGPRSRRERDGNAASRSCRPERGPILVCGNVPEAACSQGALKISVPWMVTLTGTASP
jgi:hypothetical protein